MVAPEGEKPKARSSENLAWKVGDTIGRAALGAGIPIPGDLLAGAGAEETVTVVRDDHDQVVSAFGVRREADAEQPPTGTRATGRQGSGAATTGAASIRSGMPRWYAESFGSCSACSVADDFFARNIVALPHSPAGWLDSQPEWRSRILSRSPGVARTTSAPPS